MSHANICSVFPQEILSACLNALFKVINTFIHIKLIHNDSKTFIMLQNISILNAVLLNFEFIK